MFVNELVNLGEGAGRYELMSSDVLLRALIVAIEPEIAESFQDEDEYGFLEALIQGRMLKLAELGMVQVDKGLFGHPVGV
ncbi:hypothetical protein, partial [Microbacterium sp. SD291]|uniref:hypothetical protein n=1 Tax=Microbacterium sp. SD291 TaxID=2782007 RepID=UPI001A96E6FF